MLRRLIFCSALCLATCSCVSAQTSAPDGASPPDGFKLKVASRLVIEDLTVTDRAGKPVTGLPRSAFHLLDNKAPQQPLDFEESTPDGPGVVDTGTLHSNRSVVRNDATLVALLIDPMSIELQDQMYLRVQTLRFLETVSSGTQVAVFRANNRGVPVLLQSPTADHALLRAAVEHAVPVIARPIDSAFANGIAQLGNISNYFREIPGRKAVLWLAGQFPLYDEPNTAFSEGNNTPQREARKAAYRALEQARVVVYPIDVRGVLMGGPFLTVRTNEAAAAQDPSIAAKPLLGESARAVGGYQQMDALAVATGGQAFYSNNAVSTLMQKASNLASSSYALSYRPTNYVADGSWHTVSITVDGPYTVHYRTGYYSEDRAGASPGEQRRVQAKNGVTEKGPAAAAPGDSSLPAAPILFSARVVSEGKAGKTETIRIRYIIPTTQLRYNGGSGQARFRVVALAYNAWGDVLNHAMDTIETHFSPEQMQLATRIGTPADQTLTVAKGAQYLLLAVEDLKTERVGTVQLPLATVQPTHAAAVTP